MKKNNFIHRLLISILTLSVITGMSGCVTTSDMESLRMEVRQNRSQLNKKIDSLDQQMDQADKSIRNEIKTSNNPMQTRQANIWVEVNSLKMDVAKLQGSLDSLTLTVQEINGGDSNSTISLRELSQQFSHMRMALESQLDMDLNLIKPHNEKKHPASVSATISQATGIAAVLASSTKKEKTADPAQALYNKALESFKAREYKKAIVDWSEFTKTFPKNSLVPNSIFWEGECYYQLKDYPNAALKYQVVIAKYPSSNKFKSAMLKQGICLIKLGKTKSGKYILEDLVKKAPESAEAKRAKDVIKNLK
ncbi:tol-pal system protein YbgF [Maridesulfovibrio ferrireducens]|uniref:Tol-pal system protein YbgF n=1 Tax=Maridesulfovibrio ferrireducens TaxID=246191 RepID=A0A1G9I6R3_9BACT|nr:tol-pal system protein YbgF [Maridesulfovibrio ferrireducens]SDL20918.1 tol-pal system protein YbgF [Maridesulfovibrio ferrireducens]